MIEIWNKNSRVRIIVTSIFLSIIVQIGTTHAGCRNTVIVVIGIYLDTLLYVNSII